MSVPTPKFRPMSRLSLSVMSNLQKLSATRSSSRGSSTPICRQLPFKLKWNRWPPSRSVLAAPMKRSPSYCGPSARPFTKPIPAGATSNFQLNCGSPVHRSGQHEQARERLRWRVRDQGGGPADLLQAEIGAADARIRRGTCLDRLVLGDARDRPHDLHPAAVRAGLDQTELGKAVIAVLLQPEVAGLRIEVHAKAVAQTVGEYFLDVGADLSTHHGAHGEKWVVGRGAAVVVEPQDDAGEMRVVGRRATELVIRHCRS